MLLLLMLLLARQRQQTREGIFREWQHDDGGKPRGCQVVIHRRLGKSFAVVRQPALCEVVGKSKKLPSGCTLAKLLSCDSVCFPTSGRAKCCRSILLHSHKR